MASFSTEPVLKKFRQIFVREPAAIRRAPGRVNVIGEHTDYNDGWALPMPIGLHTHVAVAPRDDGRIVCASAQFAASAPIAWDFAGAMPQRAWQDYVQGMFLQVARHCPLFNGADVWVDSAVPVGSGLSSSAALAVALGRAARAVWQLPLSEMDLALMAQACENEFVGAHVGVMDPVASSCGSLGACLMLNAATLAYRAVPVPATVDIAIIHSGVKHANADGGYNLRRQECARATAALRVDSLASLGEDALPRIATLPAPLQRRAKHVVTENARVIAAVEAIEAGQIACLGNLMNASHASLRDDYEVSVPEVDALVRAANGTSGVLGARLTGGGFGGCVIILTLAEQGQGCARQIVEQCAGQAPLASVVLPK